MSNKSENDRIGNHQIVILLYIKRYRQKVKRTHKEWEETFANHTSSKGFVLDYIKELTT